MPDKNKYDREYDEGYLAGKEGDFVDDFSHNLVKGYRIPGSNDKIRQSYNAGYEDGASDRGDSSDSHYSGVGIDSGGGCFITTATLTALGRSNDCPELNTFRSFRNEWLPHQPGGLEAIEEYYRSAPGIVAKINSQPEPIQIYLQIWTDTIRPCLDLLTHCQYDQVRSIYESAIRSLKDRYTK